MKSKIVCFLSAAMIICAAPAALKAQSQEQIDKFNEERKAYFTEKLELTDAEGKAFWPLYEDFFWNRNGLLKRINRFTESSVHYWYQGLKIKRIEFHTGEIANTFVEFTYE